MTPEELYESRKIQERIIAANNIVSFAEYAQALERNYLTELGDPDYDEISEDAQKALDMLDFETCIFDADGWVLGVLKSRGYKIDSIDGIDDAGWLNIDVENDHNHLTLHFTPDYIVEQKCTCCDEPLTEEQLKNSFRMIFEGIEDSEACENVLKEAYNVIKHRENG